MPAEQVQQFVQQAAGLGRFAPGQAAAQLVELVAQRDVCKTDALQGFGYFGVYFRRVI